MKLLIIGGTIFLGRYLVEAAQARGHEVTLFNRGQHNPDLFAGVEKIRGDRTKAEDLAPLKGRRFDAVIDTCGYVPRVVRMSAEVLAEGTEHYTFVSTCSVYGEPTTGPDESTPVVTLADPTVEQVTGETYGGLKALCEQAAEAAMPGRVLNVRPGLIVGPHDPSDRFTYWPVRVARGGEVLAPGRPDRPVQFIDVRDLARWHVRAAEARLTGIFNATGPVQPVPMEHLLATCRTATGSDARFTWVPDEWLLEQKVGPWMELPLWIPDGNMDGFMHVQVGKAVAAGLTFRPLADTVRDTVTWAASRPADTQWRAGMKAEREAELLALWQKG
jgi:2'-hydroxyisoflavone reductase